MDDEDIEWELARMDGGRQEGQPEFSQVRPGVDRDFAERIFRMFARPFDPNWQMPDTSGPEYLAEPKQDRTALQNYGDIIKNDEEWLRRNNPGKIIEGEPRMPQSQPPVKIIIGGKEYPAEIGKDGKLQIGF